VERSSALGVMRSQLIGSFLALALTVSANWARPEGVPKIWWERTLGSKMSEPTCVVLLGPAISAAGGRAGVAQCYLSKLTGKLIWEEQQLSAADEG